MQAGAWTGEADCVFAPPAGEHEIQTVKNYRFYVSAPIGCTRLCAGETKPGVAPPRPVTGKRPGLFPPIHLTFALVHLNKIRGKKKGSVGGVGFSVFAKDSRSYRCCERPAASFGGSGV